MSKSALLAAAAVIAFTTGGASAAEHHPWTVATTAKVNPVVRHTKGVTVLYNQNSNSNGENIDSQTYTSGTYSSYNDQGADDFIVPKGSKWTVTEVDVTGCCVGSNPNENVYFYKDNSGVPGAAVKHGSFTDLNGSGAPNFAITLPKKGLKLKAGHYWVSVQVNCNYLSGCGEWGWTMNGTAHNDAAVWQQPGNGAGTGCTSWATLTTCFGYTGDFMFELQGKSKK